MSKMIECVFIREDGYAFYDFVDPDDDSMSFLMQVEALKVMHGATVAMSLAEYERRQQRGKALVAVPLDMLKGTLWLLNAEEKSNCTGT